MSSKSYHHQTKSPQAGQVRAAHSRRKIPLAALLVERGFFEELDDARRWVMAGKVFVDNQRLEKPGMPVPDDVALQVRGRSRYVSRGGYKLEAALAYFAVEVAARVALDCGACTGGFTDCLLQHGAALIYAVDAGYGQLHGQLRADTRVRNLERSNLGDLSTIVLEPPPTLITLDLSYLSLTKALPVAATLLAPQGQILALVKPLFEVRSSQARRTGRIPDPSLVVEALERILQAGIRCGLTAQGIAKLALRPRHGIHEFFASFVRSPGALPWNHDEQKLLAIIEGQGIGQVEEG